MSARHPAATPEAAPRSVRRTVYPHQEQAYRELLTTARVLFGGRWSELPVQPRFNVLLVGSSGLGKTALVRMVAQTLSVPIFEQSTASWILIGTSGRGAVPTWPSLFDFLIRHDRGVIFIDEIDKVHGGGEWTTYLRSELYSLLDRTVPIDLIRASNLSSDLPPDTATQGADHQVAQFHLGSGMLLVAAGAFQSYWEQLEKRRVGFGAAEERHVSLARPTLDAFSHLLPRELVNRFRAKLAYLEPMRLGGYITMLQHTAKRLPEELVEPFLQLGFDSAFAAVESRLGARWIEELMTEVLMQEAAATSATERPAPAVQ